MIKEEFRKPDFSRANSVLQTKRELFWKEGLLSKLIPFDNFSETTKCKSIFAHIQVWPLCSDLTKLLPNKIVFSDCP